MSSEATRFWILWFPWVVLGFFSTCKILEKSSFGHSVLEIFLIFFLLCEIFSYILLFYTYAKCLNFKPFATHMQLHIMFSNQCKQWYSYVSTLCHHSGWPTVRDGVVRECKEKKGLFKVIQKKSGRFVWQDQRKINVKG